MEIISKYSEIMNTLKIWLFSDFSSQPKKAMEDKCSFSALRLQLCLLICLLQRLAWRKSFRRCSPGLYGTTKISIKLSVGPRQPSALNWRHSKAKEGLLPNDYEALKASASERSWPFCQTPSFHSLKLQSSTRYMSRLYLSRETGWVLFWY